MSKVKILIGCCGFPVSRRKYFKEYKLVEVQQTFYKIPAKETLERWRKEAPPDFTFTIKAWQAITHPPSSPTWKKAGLKIDEGKKDRYGLLKPTKENLEAWEKTLEAALLLNARVIVVQTPPSFKFSKENYENARIFFSSIKKPGVVVAWEPRGDWHKYREQIAKLIEETEIVYVVDPLRLEPLVHGHIAYFRLHGLGHREVNYRYKYSDNDLERLSSVIEKVINTSDLREIYVLFNNVHMYNDARRFKEIAARHLNDIANIV